MIVDETLRDRLQHEAVGLNPIRCSGMRRPAVGCIAIRYSAIESNTVGSASMWLSYDTISMVAVAVPLSS